MDGNDQVVAMVAGVFVLDRTWLLVPFTRQTTKKQHILSVLTLVVVVGGGEYWGRGVEGGVNARGQGDTGRGR